MSRAVLGLGWPEDSVAPLKDFPRGNSPSSLYRAHSSAHGPWYFAPLPAEPRHGGRFDLAAPHGTCYVANNIEACVRERLGPGRRDVRGFRTQRSCVKPLCPVCKPDTAHPGGESPTSRARKPPCGSPVKSRPRSSTPSRRLGPRPSVRKVLSECAMNRGSRREINEPKPGLQRQELTTNFHRW